MCSIFGSLLAVAIFSVAPNVAGAQGDSGYVEICKTFSAGPAGAPQYQGTFNYTITDVNGATYSASLAAVEGNTQPACTAPIEVAAGTATVTEASEPWFSVTSITGGPGSSVTPNSDGYSATVNVVAGDVSNTATVNYTNAPVTGTIEVCKAADSSSPTLTGTYTFNVTSTEAGIMTYDSTTGAYDLPWTTTTSATISSAGTGCSGPITVPAGTIETVEPGTTYVTDITATSNGNDVLADSDYATGTADTTVSAGDTTDQTIVTYTDALSTVKLCKVWDGSASNTQFPFTLSSSGPAGPTAVSSSVTLGGNSCTIVGYVRTGTQVNITEGVTPGTKVESIDVGPTTNSQGMSPIVPGTSTAPDPDLANGTVSIIAGAGETVVTYTDEAASMGNLKICVMPTSNPTAGTVPFLVGTEMLNVNLSSTAIQCTLDPMTYAFDSSVAISGGTLPSGDAFTGTASVVPTNVEVWENGVLTPTSQSSLVSGSASSATVLLSEGIVTEVTFTVDPPAPVVAPTKTATPSAAAVASASAGLPALGASNKKTVSPAAVRNLIKKQVSHVRSQIRRLEKQLRSKHLSRAARRADARKLASLRRLLPQLLRELK